MKYIEYFAKFWKDIANEDGTLNSAYGHLIFARLNEHGKTQWQWAVESLKNDKDSRQAIMHFNTPDHQRSGNKDFVCTLNVVFHIRDNKLFMTNMMRSNDVILGLPTDVAFFSMLQQQMCMILKETYPDLSLGTYTHMSNSMHLYERNFAVVKEMLDFEFESMPFVLSESLVGEFGEMTPVMERLHDEVNLYMDDTFLKSGSLASGSGTASWIFRTIAKIAPELKQIHITNAPTNWGFEKKND